MALRARLTGQRDATLRRTNDPPDVPALAPEVFEPGRACASCHEFLYGQLTDSNTLGIWLNGNVNGARGKTLIDPLSTGHIGLVHYCEDHTAAPVLDAARRFLVPTNNYLAFTSAPKSDD